MQAILQTCVQIEERVGAIYAELAQHPEANEELQQLWQEMADDEARHAKRIRLVADRLDEAALLVGSLRALHHPGCDLGIQGRVPDTR